MKGILPLSFTIQVIDTTPLYVYTFIHFGVKIIYSLFFFLFNSFCSLFLEPKLWLNVLNHLCWRFSKRLQKVGTSLVIITFWGGMTFCRLQRFIKHSDGNQNHNCTPISYLGRGVYLCNFLHRLTTWPNYFVIGKDLWKFVNFVQLIWVKMKDSNGFLNLFFLCFM